MKHLCLIVLFVAAGVCYAGNGITIMFYNTENLFDTIDDTCKNDDEYTPYGSRKWTEKRYWNKLNSLSKVIAAVAPMDSPALVGLCEVENKTVLDDLTCRSALKNAGYEYVMTNSGDIRGIDVALLYKNVFFRYISHESLYVDLFPESDRPTRDILHVTGRIVSGDTLDIYVCHWPSRLGGVEQTEKLRSKAAAVVKSSAERVFCERRKPYVVIMGDLNEGPDDTAVRDVLQAECYTVGKLYDDRNLLTLMDTLDKGSYRYEGEWEKYDQFIVSSSLVNGLGSVEVLNVYIYNASFLLVEDDDYGGYKPFRTYKGYRYQGGFSDHLPIILRLEY